MRDAGHRRHLPMIGDSDMSVAKLYGMIHPNGPGRVDAYRGDNATVRTVFVVRVPTRRSSSCHLSDEHGTQLRRGCVSLIRMEAHLEVFGGNAGQLEARRRVIILASVSEEDAKKKFPAVEVAEAVPSPIVPHRKRSA